MELNTFKFEIDSDGIAIAVFDVPNRSMNTLTAEAFREVFAIAEEVKSSKQIKGLIFTSGKESGFCAGADLDELGGGAGQPITTPEEAATAFEQAFGLSKAFRVIETCGKPVAVAVNGLALGGGLELVLSCHYRVVANDRPKLQLGLPEAKVGLLPGAGGTQRLPRLIGIQAALPLLLEGKSVSAENALSLGIVQEAAPAAETLAKAKAWVMANPNYKAPWDQKGFKVPGGIVNKHPGATQVAQVAPAMLAAKTFGNYPAQNHIMSCVYEGIQVPIDHGLRIESRYFVKTLAQPEAKAMIRSLFLSTQALSKGASRPTRLPKQEFKKIAVIGAGLMGAGIAYEQARARIPTVLVDISVEQAEKGKQYSKRLVDKAISRGKITAEKGEALLACITPTNNYEEIREADLVIEAVFEDPALKAKITAKAEDHLEDTAVFGSNTSTLPISELAKASKQPQNFIGIHFFSPVERMGLVEIIVGEKTSQETIAKAIDYVIGIRKTPIIVNDRRGFYTSRCFGTYTLEGMNMLQEGIKPAIIENVGRQSGMPMGPLEVSDSVGLDTSLKVSRQMAEHSEHPIDSQNAYEIIAWLVETENRIGRKAGKGFYEYNTQNKPEHIWPGLSQKVKVQVDECPPELKKELTNRLLIRQAIEVARCFEEGVITDARDADVGSILAWGFSPYTGGCCSYVDLIWGLKNFIQEADRLADKYGERFRPNELLRDMLAKGQTFYDRFPPASFA